MNTSLDALDPRFKPLAIELLARCVEAGIAVRIINTKRTEEEQRAILARGASWVQRSKHQDGLAIDICPYSVFDLNGPDKLQWDGSDPVWEKIGLLGEALGLRWGGRWAKKDFGHFELKTPKPKEVVT